MDEYLLEINDLRRRIARLKFERASQTIIEELEAQLRILKAIYDSVSALYADNDPRLQAGFAERELGSWTFENVYFYVYEQAVALEPAGHDLATQIWRHDYRAGLMSPVPQQVEK
jgi:DNA mismatch repair ATPase MutS